MDNESEADNEIADVLGALDREAPAPAPKTRVPTVVITDNFISHELAPPRVDKPVSQDMGDSFTEDSYTVSRSGSIITKSERKSHTGTKLVLGRSSDPTQEQHRGQAVEKQQLNPRRNRDTDTARFKSQKSAYSSGSDFAAIKDIAEASGGINLPQIVRAEGAKHGDPAEAPYDSQQQQRLGRYGPASPA